MKSDHSNNSGSIRQIAFNATLHCLTGCAVGEILGMILGSSLGWGNITTIGVSIILAFFFGYSLTLIPLFNSGLSLAQAFPIALAGDTLSITTMEVVDNLILLLIPGALDAPVDSLLFWASLAFSLAVAFIAAFPVNYYLISQGKGHAGSHSHH